MSIEVRESTQRVYEGGGWMNEEKVESRRSAQGYRKLAQGVVIIRLWEDLRPGCERQTVAFEAVVNGRQWWRWEKRSPRDFLSDRGIWTIAGRLARRWAEES